MEKRVWFAGGILLSVVIVVAGIIFFTSPFNATKVKAVKADRRTLDLTISASGKVVADRKTNVSSVQSGRVSVIYVKEGDLVQTNSPLLSLEADNLNLAVEQAGINVEIAASNEQNARSSKRTAQTNLDQARAGVSAGQTTVNNAILNQAQAGLDAAGQAVVDIQDLNQSSLSLAQNALQQAQAGYAGAQQAVIDARAQWDEAISSFGPTDIRTLGYESAFHQAESASQTARLALDSAGLALENTQRMNTQVLHGAQAQAQTAQKAYELALAQYNLARSGATAYDISILQDQLSIASNLYKIAQKQADLANLGLETAQLQLDNATITSPIPGLVASINVKPGELVTSGMPGTPPVVVIIDTSSLRFLASADETDITKIKAGQLVEITMDAYDQKLFSGRVLSTGITPVQTEGGAIAYAVDITFDQKGISGLREGMNGDADIIIGQAGEVLVVPASAVLDEEGKTYVLLIGTDSRLKKKLITVRRTLGEFFEVTDGIDEGQQIVGQDVKDFKEGDKVSW